MYKRHYPAIFLLLLFASASHAQMETRWLDTTYLANHKEFGYMMTNRKMVEKGQEAGTTFRNRWIRQTGTLYFCRYDFENQILYPRYKASKTGRKKLFPTEPVKDNFFYQVYQDLRIDNDIRNFVFIIPGHAKTFKKQLEDYMFRLQREYADSLKSTAFITFAWGSESIGPLYYRGQRAADESSNDFSIFQHLLDSFISDTVFWNNNPGDISIKLISTSMGNEMFRRYLLKREMQDIPLVKTYDRIILIGSDAPSNALEPGEGFDHLLELSESVLILVNGLDGPLTLSQYMNLRLRLGKAGPTNLEDLPEEIIVRDVTHLISLQDLPALGHDYFLRNEDIMNYILHQQLTDEFPSDLH